MNINQIKNGKISQRESSVWGKIVSGIQGSIGTVVHAVFFSLVLFLLLLVKLIAFVLRWILFMKEISRRFDAMGVRWCKWISGILYREQDGIGQVDLIGLSMKNLAVKKTRTVVTVGGMMVGIGSIVFLVSLGYGVQNLVISRVAKLDEVKQCDVVMQTGRKIKITDETLNSFNQIQHVEAVLPLIASVGKVSYSNSNSDMAVYGVQADYLKKSAIKPSVGEIFDSNDVVTKIDGGAFEAQEAQSNLVAEAVRNNEIRKVDFVIDPGQWVKVRSSAGTEGDVIGYSKNTAGLSGNEVWGDAYADNENGSAGKDRNGAVLGKWISATVPLWEKKKCSVGLDQGCEDGQYMPIKVNGKQDGQAGYFAEIGVSSIQTAAEDVAQGGDQSGLQNNATNVSIPAQSVPKAVVNQAVLKILGIPEQEAVGKTFSLSLVLSGDQLAVDDKKIETAGVKYTIVGVVPDTKVPVIYIPFINLRSLGVTNYSQVKIAVDGESRLADTRKQIEAMGYTTHSVVDTINQINSFFTTIRVVLGFFGFIALTVAALGMFNTLTVSLLERTREVGLLKALGMRSGEVRKLFLTESMTMGFMGGLLGILLGFVGGKLVSIGISAFAYTKGLGTIDVSFIPLSFALIIILLSVVTGIVTGIYPARRATKISALNALRYE